MGRREGSWGLACRLLLLFVACLSWSCSDDRTSPPGPEIYGTWLGSIDAGPTPLRIVFNLSYSPTGGVEGTVDSPDQGSFGAPITRAQIMGSSVTIEVESLGLTFVGELADDEQTMVGELRQADERASLKLTKQSGPLNYRRPQDPVPPFPYQTAEVTFPSEDANVTVAGTLVWPDGDGPFIAVALITGSGAQNRDEELVNHRPFAVLADALVRQNIAVLRYDDRGFGESTGNFAAATTESFAADARGAVRFLRSQEKFQTGTVGLIGHSEGGLVGPLAADGSPDVGFLVLLAGTGVDGKTTLLSQSRAIGAAEGASAEELDAGDAQLNELYSCFGDPQDELETLDICLRELLVNAGLEGTELSSTLTQLETPWMRFFVTYDPKPVLERTTIPVLALHGSLDLQVVADLNAPAIEGALKEAGNEQASVQTLPGLNHLFQHAVTGHPREYGTIDETLSPQVLTLIPEWIKTVVPDAP